MEKTSKQPSKTNITPTITPQDFLDSETEYVDQLQILSSTYIQLIETYQKNEFKENVDISIFCVVLKHLYTMNRDFLASLKSEIEHGGTISDRIAVFQKFSNEFSFYANYANKYIGLLDFVRLKCRFDPKFSSLMNENASKLKIKLTSTHDNNETTSSNHGLEVFKYILKCPLFRIQYYLQYLSVIYCEANLTDELKEEVNDLILDFRKTVDDIDLIREEQDRIELIHEIEARFVGDVKLVGPNRHFVQNGILEIFDNDYDDRSTPYMFHLFNDLLIYSSPEISGNSDANTTVSNEIDQEGSLFQLQRRIYLQNFIIRECSIDDKRALPTTFEVLSTGKPFIVKASSIEQKLEWMNAINACVSALNRNIGQNLFDEDGELLHPVQADDNSSDKCSICSEKFSLFFRRHHCRRCGCLVCYECSNKNLLLPHINKHNPVRVCNICFQFVESVRKHTSPAYRYPAANLDLLAKQHCTSTTNPPKSQQPSLNNTGTVSTVETLFHNGKCSISSQSLFSRSVGNPNFDESSLSDKSPDRQAVEFFNIEEHVYLYHINIIFEKIAAPLADTMKKLRSDTLFGWFSSSSSTKSESLVSEFIKVVEDMRNQCVDICNELNFQISFSELQNSPVDIGKVYDSKREYFEAHKEYAVLLPQIMELLLSEDLEEFVLEIDTKADWLYGLKIYQYLDVPLMKMKDLVIRFLKYESLFSHQGKGYLTTMDCVPSTLNNGGVKLDSKNGAVEKCDQTQLQLESSTSLNLSAYQKSVLKIRSQASSVLKQLRKFSIKKNDLVTSRLQQMLICENSDFDIRRRYLLHDAVLLSVSDSKMMCEENSLAMPWGIIHRFHLFSDTLLYTKEIDGKYYIQTIIKLDEMQVICYGSSISCASPSTGSSFSVTNSPVANDISSMSNSSNSFKINTKSFQLDVVCKSKVDYDILLGYLMKCFERIQMQNIYQVELNNRPFGLSIDPESLIVLNVVRDSLAFRKQIRSGDKLLSVNGWDPTVELMRGNLPLSLIFLKRQRADKLTPPIKIVQQSRRNTRTSVDSGPKSRDKHVSFATPITPPVNAVEPLEQIAAYGQDYENNLNVSSENPNDDQNNGSEIDENENELNQKHVDILDEDYTPTILSHTSSPVPSISKSRSIDEFESTELIDDVIGVKDSIDSSEKIQQEDKQFVDESVCDNNEEIFVAGNNGIDQSSELFSSIESPSLSEINHSETNQN